METPRFRPSEESSGLGENGEPGAMDRAGTEGTPHRSQRCSTAGYLAKI